ncbi:hypothetical protein LUZ60_001400 [Juncus effusus]|nr:hypothetical protein LUZ60_001400 [Juncus effusus]
MGNCVVIQRERTWADDDYEEDFGFSENPKKIWQYNVKNPQKEERFEEVKIKITKKQLKELVGSKRSTSIEKALEEIINRGIVYHEHVKEEHWKPRLHSIPESLEER